MQRSEVTDSANVPRGAFQAKPYVTARKAAELLGLPLERIVADIDAGCDGDVYALVGAAYHGVYLIPSWELEGERLAMHRQRLADTSNLCAISGVE